MTHDDSQVYTLNLDEAGSIDFEEFFATLRSILGETLNVRMEYVEQGDVSEEIATYFASMDGSVIRSPIAAKMLSRAVESMTDPENLDAPVESITVRFTSGAVERFSPTDAPLTTTREKLEKSLAAGLDKFEDLTPLQERVAEEEREAAEARKHAQA